VFLIEASRVSLAVSYLTKHGQRAASGQAVPVSHLHLRVSPGVQENPPPWTSATAGDMHGQIFKGIYLPEVAQGHLLSKIWRNLQKYLVCVILDLGTL